MVFLTPLGRERQAGWHSGGYGPPEGRNEPRSRPKAKGLGPPVQGNGPPEMRCPGGDGHRESAPSGAVARRCPAPSPAASDWACSAQRPPGKDRNRATGARPARRWVVSREPCSHLQLPQPRIMNNLVFEWKVHFDGRAMLSEGPRESPFASFSVSLSEGGAWE